MARFDLIKEYTPPAGSVLTFYTAGSAHDVADKVALFSDSAYQVSIDNPITLGAEKQIAAYFAETTVDLHIEHAIYGAGGIWLLDQHFPDTDAAIAAQVAAEASAVATAADRIQTAADRVQTGLDVTAANASAAAATGMGYPTKALMDAAAGLYTEGQVVRVADDPTPANNGDWIKGVSVFTQSSYDRVAVVEKTASILQGSQLAESVPNKLPDLWRDGPFYRSVGTAAKIMRQGFETLYLSTAGAYRTLSVPVTDFAGTNFDASVICIEKNAIANAVFIVRQNDAGGAEIAGTRTTLTLPPAAITAPTLFEAKGVAIHASTVLIEFWMGAGSSGAFPYFALPLLAEATGWTGYRPRAVGPQIADLANFRQNLIADPFFSDLSLWEYGTLSTVVRDDKNGLPTVRIDSGSVPSTSIRYSIPRSMVLGDVVSASVVIPEQNGTPSRIMILQKNSLGSEIAGTRGELSILSTTAKPFTAKLENITIDTSCVDVEFWLDKQSSATSIHFQLPCVVAANMIAKFHPPKYSLLADGGGNATVYVSADGLDTNAGTMASPLATFAAAISMLGGNGQIIIRGGDYTETIALGSAERLLITTYPQERVRLLLGTLITNIIKEGGYSKVYRGDLVTAPNKHIFEHETPEGLIPAAERHSLQRGRGYRLPSTRIWPVTSIAAVDADERPSWFHDNVTGKIYFSAADGGDATTHDYYSTGNTSGASGGTAATQVEVQGIESWYGVTGFSFANCGSYRAVDLFAFGANGNGIVGDYATGTEIRCEGAGCGGDGMNAHHQITTPEATTRNGVYIRIDPWAHDNYDDGNSIHERCQETIIGGLFEYNGDRGVVPASGAHTTIHDAYSRKNGQNTRGTAITGEGFGIINTNQAGEGGVGTQLECHGCISDQDNYGFAAHSTDGIVRAFGCKTINAEIAAYSANLGSVFLHDCTDDGSSVVKLAAGGGVITVSNGLLVS